MTTTARDIGTLIVVVLKARNLPNKRQFGKQDPYCVVALNGQTRKTKIIKRGGQHPEWDEEVRFTIYEDSEALRGSNDGTPPPLPPKAGRGPKKIQGGEKMALACFAADKEPELIGEATVDLTEALTKGETDEWFTLLNRDKYSGEVYLELTFWSNEPRPEKRATPKHAMVNKQYGGPGVFVPSEEAPGHFQQGSDSFQDRRRRDSVPSPLLPSNSSLGLDLYKPDYEQTMRARTPHGASTEQLVNDMGELMVSDPRRRDTFPPMQSGFSARSVSTSGHSVASSTSSQVFPVPESNAPDASTSSYVHRAITPAGHRPHRYSLSSSQSHEIPQYQPAYEHTLSSSKPSYHPPSRHGPRYSMPAASSGFMPVSSTFDSTLRTTHALASYGSEPSGLAPLSANATLTLPGYVPRPPHTPAPTSYIAPSVSPAPTFSTTSVSVGSFMSSSLPQQPQALYGAQARYSPPVTAPPASHLPTSRLSTSTPPQLAQSQIHAALTQPVGSQPQEYSPSSHVRHISPSRVVSNHVPGSRPLPPQPQHVPQRLPIPASVPANQTYGHAIGPPIPYGQGQVPPLTSDVGLPPVQQNPLPIPPGPPGPLGPRSRTVSNAVLPTGPSYHHTPSPSPQPSPSQQSLNSRMSEGTVGSILPSSVPPPPGHPRSVSGRPSLPPPPSAMVSYHQQSFPQLPIPPPLLPGSQSQPQYLSPSTSSVMQGGQVFYPGPPPRPPTHFTESLQYNQAGL